MSTPNRSSQAHEDRLARVCRRVAIASGLALLAPVVSSPSALAIDSWQDVRKCNPNNRTAGRIPIAIDPPEGGWGVEVKVDYDVCITDFVGADLDGNPRHRVYAADAPMISTKFTHDEVGNWLCENRVERKGWIASNTPVPQYKFDVIEECSVGIGKIRAHRKLTFPTTLSIYASANYVQIEAKDAVRQQHFLDGRSRQDRAVRYVNSRDKTTAKKAPRLGATVILSPRYIGSRPAKFREAVVVAGKNKVSRLASWSERQYGAFRLRKGLAGRGYSFESAKFPGFYLRHRDGVMYLNKANGTKLFRQDASFLFEGDPVGGAPTRLRASNPNLPLMYVRHRDGNLRIDYNSQWEMVSWAIQVINTYVVARDWSDRYFTTDTLFKVNVQ